MIEIECSVEGPRRSPGKTREADLRQRSSVARPSAGDSHPPIDFDHLRRYTFGDEKLEREVLELFCNHAPWLLAEMKAADCEAAWRNAAHSLKGSAMAVGAMEVAHAAEEAETCAASFGEARDIIVRLESALDRVKGFLAQQRLNA